MTTLRICAKYLLLFVSLHQCSGVIYRLNDTEYDKMPPVFHLDSYDMCLREPEGFYCTMDFTLVSDKPNTLLYMIQEYSEFTPKHFNHSKLTYGLCVSNICNMFHDNKTTDLRLTLEECLNETMWERHQLKTKISDEFYCNRHDEVIQIYTGDIIVAVIITVVLLLNVIGSFYDICFTKTDDVKISNKILMCFSIRRNWKKLRSPAADGPEPRLKRLVGINGVKSTSMMLVIMAHSIICFGYCVDNTWDLEKRYDSWLTYIVLNGTMIVQTFLVISGFLLVYNLQLYMEKHEMNWNMLPKGILMRWLRLSPPYAIVLAYVSTWHRFIGTGPLWQKAAMSEVSDCKRIWWMHLLYLNNYLENSNCLCQTWYLAVDMQLYILGLIVYLACRSTKSRTVVLSLLFLAGMVMPAAITYYKDLDPMMMLTLETTRALNVRDPTLTNVYTPGHTNMSSYVLGLAAGYLVYYVQQQGFAINKYKRYRFVYWSALPFAFGLLVFGKIFYMEAPRASVYFRAVTAALLKPIFGSLIALLIGLSVLKYENVFRSYVEWGFWTPVARLSYSAYLLHFTMVRYMIGTQTTLMYVSSFLMTFNVCGTICLSYLGGCVFWLLVEEPIGRLVKILLMRPEK